MERRKVLNVIFIVLIAAWLIAEALAYVFIVTKKDQQIPFSVTYLSIVADLLVTLGILLYAFVAVFQLVTLPVEFDASHRAVKVMEETGMDMMRRIVTSSVAVTDT